MTSMTKNAKLSFLKNILQKLKNKKEKVHGPYKSVQHMLDEQKARDKKHPILTFWKNNIYYPVWRLCDKIKMFPKEVKWFIQRGSRGWADCDAWAVDWHICKILPPMLKKLRDNLCGHPAQLSDKTWRKTLNEMIWLFETAAGVQDHDIVFPSKKKENKALEAHYKKYNIKKLTQKEYKRYLAAWKLFQEHFYSLWD